MATAMVAAVILIVIVFPSACMLVLVLKGIPQGKLPYRGHEPTLQQVKPRWLYWILAPLSVLLFGSAVACGVYQLFRLIWGE